jgi:hypothetical protein
LLSPNTQSKKRLSSLGLEQNIIIIMTTRNKLINDILNDSFLVKKTLQKFVDAAKALVKKEKNADLTKDYATWNMDTVLNAAKIEKIWTKESYMSVALWVLFFAITGEHYPSAQLKYQNVNAFLEAYEGYFNDLEPAEQEILKDEANWFNVVSTLLPPSKSKGLSIQVVPRLVEGWQAKYVTGSGQTDTTKRRVHIFEKEGGVAPHVREGSRRIKIEKKDRRITTKVAKKTKRKYFIKKTKSPLTRKKRLSRVKEHSWSPVNGRSMNW